MRIFEYIVDSVIDFTISLVSFVVGIIIFFAVVHVVTHRG